MNRRALLKITGKLLGAAAIMGLWPACRKTMTAEKGENVNVLHYRPLNGLKLKEIAARKMHHGSDGFFLNPLGELRRPRGFGRVLYWKLFSPNRFKTFEKDQRTNPVHIDWTPIKKASGVSVTFVKHSCILIKDIDRYLIVDPVFFKIFRFIEDFSPLAFEVDQMPKPDHVLVTHGHYDHLDKASLAAFPRNTHVITPLGYDKEFSDLEMSNRTQLDWYDSYAEGNREIILLPCNHWTMRTPITGPNRSLWGSYLIRTAGGKTIFVSGDTAWFEGFNEIGETYDIDLAVFSLGAYEPRWFMASSHINPEETVKAFKQLQAKKLIIVHWGTFQLGDEPIHFPPMDLKRALEKEGMLDRWVRLRHGETYFV